MEVLRLKLYQETVSYTRPIAQKVGETYPLPPISTVSGMLHALMKANDYIPMNLSIQGTYESRIVDYQKHYFFKKKSTNEFALVLDGLGFSHQYEEITTMPTYVHLLYNVHLIVHIYAPDEVFRRIEHGIANGTSIALGRWEDLVRIDACERVKIEKVPEIILTNDMYVLADDQEEGTSGIPYRLNWKYTIRQGIRQWDRLPTMYYRAGAVVTGDHLWRDDQENVVAFLSKV